MLPELKLLKEATTNLKNEDDRLFEMVKNWDIALDTVSDPIMVVDDNCIIKCVNQAMVETFGKQKKEDMIGKPCHKRVITETSSKKGCSCFTKNRFFYDGQLRKWFNHQSSIIHGKDDVTIGRICILKDVTEQKNMEDALRDKLSLFERKFDGECNMGIEDIISLDVLQELQLTFASICGIACVIVDGHGVPITPPTNFCDFCKLWRTSKDAMGFCNISKAFHYNNVVKAGKTIIGVCQHFPQLLEATIPLYVCGRIVGVIGMGHVKHEEIPEEYMIKMANDVGIDPQKLIENYKKIPYKTYEEFERIVTFFETFCDYISLLGTKNIQQYKEINKRMKAEGELFESQNRFRDIVDVLSDWVWETDKDDKYTYCSGKVEEILGYKPEDVVGRSVFDFFPTNDSVKVYKKFNEKINNRERIVAEKNWCVAKDGRLVCVSINAVPMFNNVGEYCGYRGADILIAKKDAEATCGQLYDMDYK